MQCLDENCLKGDHEDRDYVAREAQTAALSTPDGIQLSAVDSLREYGSILCSPWTHMSPQCQRLSFTIHARPASWLPICLEMTVA